MSQAEFSLAGEFPPARGEDGLRPVSPALKGAQSERLVATTYAGLAIEPLYSRKADAQPVPARAPGAPWQILQRVDHPDPAAANAQARQDLENGATGLSVVFAGSIGANGYGIQASEIAITHVFEGVHWDAGIAVELDLRPQARDITQAVAAVVRKHGVAPAAVDLPFGLDPLRLVATRGSSAKPCNELAAAFADWVKDLARQGFQGPFVAADGRPVHAAAGSEAPELAFALASAGPHLRPLATPGLSPEDAR